jgi:beta-lactamase regulating signal transducer with metallopeptidase domain
MISSLLANGNGFSQLSPAIEALGWTLLHFVWQAAALGLALAIFLAIGRRMSPSIRYLAGCSALALMALAAIGTFAWQMAVIHLHPSRPIATSAVAATFERPPLDATSVEHSPSSLSPTEIFNLTNSFAGMLPPYLDYQPEVKGGGLEKPSTQGAPANQNASQPVLNGQTVANVDLRASNDPPQEMSAKFDNLPAARLARVWSPRDKLLAAMQSWLPWIVGLWTCGVGLLALRLAVGWGIVRRLRRQGEAPRDLGWNARLERLRVRLGVSAPVRLLCSASASVPMVIGWLRPVVLVPASLLAGLTPHQLEAVLAHELAHIRRHDYLVNLLQNIVETLFFYHPAVWWVSRQIRTEREHCCDDLAAAICGSTLDYARALTALAELRHTSGVFGLAATGGSLVNRIARLAGVGNHEPRLGWPLPVLALTSAAAIALFATNTATRSSDATKPAPPAKKRATGTVHGNVFDPAGKSVADATVWLAGPDGKGYWLEGMPILAKGHTSSDGHFELSIRGPALERLAARPRHDLEVWVRKPGLALAFRLAYDVLDRPIEIRLRPQAPRSLRVRNADDSPCGNALVAPATAHYGDDRYVGIPDIIAKELAVHSSADGRLELTGLAADELTGVRVESAESGVQRAEFRNWEWPYAATAEIGLRKTGSVEGRLLVPKECKANLSEAIVHVITTDDGDRSTWREHVAVRPERDGNFQVRRVPSGKIEFIVDVPDDWDYRPEEPQVFLDSHGDRLALRPGGKLNVDVPLSRSVRVSRIVLDAQTKQPLPGVELSLWTELPNRGRWIQQKTDENGRFAAWIVPNLVYRSGVTLPRGYVRGNLAADGQILVDAGDRERELEAIELTRGRRVHGLVVDHSGRPVGDVRIGANWKASPNEPEPRTVYGVAARKWATTDEVGKFAFDDLPCDVEMTFTPVHAGIRLAEPFKVEASNERPVQIRIGRFAFASIAGRVVDRSDRPVGDAAIVIQKVQSKETIDCLRLRTDSAGRYQTPAWFLTLFQYRVAVRSMCKEVAATGPRTVMQSCEQFPDLVIDRPRLDPTAKLIGTEVVAVVNGETIAASEIFERWSQAQLSPSKVSLAIAKKEMERGRCSEAEYRVLQEEALRCFLRGHVRTRLMAQSFWEALPESKRQEVDRQIAKMFKEYEGRLYREFPAWFPRGLDEKLKSQGASLDGLRNEFRLKMLEQEYLREWNRTLCVRAEELNAFYLEHQNEYTFPEQVRWQFLRIGFAERGGKDKARAVAKCAAAALERCDDFGSVVRKYSDGPPPPAGESLSWTKLDTPQSEELATAIRAIATGNIVPFSEVAESDQIRFGQSVTPPQPFETVSDGVANLRERENYDRESRKYFDDAGIQRWTNPQSVADLKLALALASLAAGQTSPVIEGTGCFFIVRLIERRPAGRKSQNEVAGAIDQKIRSLKKERMVDELFDRATIESPYLPDRKPNKAAAAYWTEAHTASVGPVQLNPGWLDRLNPVIQAFPE